MALGCRCLGHGQQIIKPLLRPSFQDCFHNNSEGLHFYKVKFVVLLTPHILSIEQQLDTDTDRMLQIRELVANEFNQNVINVTCCLIFPLVLCRTERCC